MKNGTANANDDDYDSSIYVVQYTADLPGYIFNCIVFAFSIIMLIYSQYYIWKVIHKHPLLIIRCPKVFAAELAINYMNAAYFAAYNSAFFNAKISCQPLACISDGLELAGNMALIGRSVLFYNQALNIGKSDDVHKYTLLQRTMDIIAFFTAPGDYFEMQTLRRFTFAVKENPDLKTNKLVIQDPNKNYGGALRYYIVIICWFVVGCAGSNVMTGIGMGWSDMFSPQSMAP
jgi:hypothetical protein